MIARCEQCHQQRPTQGSVLVLLGTDAHWFCHNICAGRWAIENKVSLANMEFFGHGPKSTSLSLQRRDTNKQSR